jgi:hypothetical protein
MGISDEGSYILVAQTLARTGHVVYNGWIGAMLGWQLYLGAALIKLFCFSYTTARTSTLLVAVVTAFVAQRTLVRALRDVRVRPDAAYSSSVWHLVQSRCMLLCGSFRSGAVLSLACAHAGRTLRGAVYR